jgi:hypothetical protein
MGWSAGRPELLGSLVMASHHNRALRTARNPRSPAIDRPLIQGLPVAVLGGRLRSVFVFFVRVALSRLGEFKRRIDLPGAREFYRIMSDKATDPRPGRTLKEFQPRSPHCASDLHAWLSKRGAKDGNAKQRHQASCLI